MRRFFKVATIAAVCQGLVIAPAHATFLDDFYSQAGAAANATPGDVVRNQSGTFITGGSVVWRVPKREFQPFLWQAPSIKAGCGGIDVYLGSFGFANSQAFIDYLRNIGQNALGLFFKMALQSMSPDLANVISEISKDMQTMNNKLGNSCEMAAQALKGVGVTQEWMNGISNSAGLAANADGSSTSMFDAYQTFKSNLGLATQKVEASAPLNSGGKRVVGPEKNFLWAAMNSGSLSDFPDQMKEIAMSLLGTQGVLKDATNADQMRDLMKAQTIKLEELVGKWNTTTVTIKKYECTTADDKCLEMAIVDTAVKPFARIAYENLVLLRDAIATRQPLSAVPGSDDALRMLGVTQLPAYKVLELTSTPGRLYLSEVFIQKYADLIGYELAIGFMESITSDLEKTLNAAKAAEQTVGEKEYLVELRKTLQKYREDARELGQKIAQSTGGQWGLIQEVERLERVLYTSFSNRMMETMRYASKS